MRSYVSIIVGWLVVLTYRAWRLKMSPYITAKPEIREPATYKAPAIDYDTRAITSTLISEATTYKSPPCCSITQTTTQEKNHFAMTGNLHNQQSASIALDEDAISCATDLQTTAASNIRRATVREDHSSVLLNFECLV